MSRNRRIKTLARIWGAIVLSMAVVYWIFLEPIYLYDHSGLHDGCQAVQRGMNLQQALKVIEAKTHPYYEILDGNKLDASSCYVTFDNGKVIHVDLPSDSLVEDSRY